MKLLRQLPDEFSVMEAMKDVEIITSQLQQQKSIHVPSQNPVIMVNHEQKNRNSAILSSTAQHETSTKPSKRTVFVGNLPRVIEDASVQEFFASCGEIKEMRWIMRDGQFKGCGFIDFADENAASNAVAMNDTPFLDRQIRVTFAEGAE